MERKTANDVHLCDIPASIPALMCDSNDLAAAAEVLYFGLIEELAQNVTKAEQYARDDCLRLLYVAR